METSYFEFFAGDYVASDLIYSGNLLPYEEALRLNLIHGIGEGQEVEQLASDKLTLLKELNSDAFSESKHMRTAPLTTEIRRQMSARVARQVEIWSSAASQKQLREAAARLNNRKKTGIVVSRIISFIIYHPISSLFL